MAVKAKVGKFCHACSNRWVELSGLLDLLKVTRYGVHDADMVVAFNRTWLDEFDTCCTCGRRPEEYSKRTST